MWHEFVFLSLLFYGPRKHPDSHLDIYSFERLIEDLEYQEYLRYKQSYLQTTWNVRALSSSTIHSTSTMKPSLSLIPLSPLSPLWMTPFLVRTLRCSIYSRNAICSLPMNCWFLPLVSLLYLLPFLLLPRKRQRKRLRNERLDPSQRRKQLPLLFLLVLWSLYRLLPLLLLSRTRWIDSTPFSWTSMMPSGSFRVCLTGKSFFTTLTRSLLLSAEICILFFRSFMSLAISIGSPSAVATRTSLPSTSLPFCPNLTPTSPTNTTTSQDLLACRLSTSLPSSVEGDDPS